MPVETQQVGVCTAWTGVLRQPSRASNLYSRPSNNRLCLRSMRRIDLEQTAPVHRVLCRRVRSFSTLSAQPDQFRRITPRCLGRVHTFRAESGQPGPGARTRAEPVSTVAGLLVL